MVPESTKLASDLIRRLATLCDEPRGFGFMSGSIYDTAWVSMVRKFRDGKLEWLFPEFFETLIKLQRPDGGWGSFSTQVDGILTIAAALLAIRRRLRDPNAVASVDLVSRSARAEEALRRMLNEWDLASSDQVGCEVLVTSHLSYLEDEGITIEFPGRQPLVGMASAKLAKLPPSYVETVPSTLLHSLEALVGKIDFERIRPLQTAGSMLASPSSTAAYLMNVSTWDQRAEAYLRAVEKRSTGSDDGLVPSAWPTTIFELAWAVSTLGDAGFSVEELDRPGLSKISALLHKTLEEQGGLVGFAPGCLPDADDTSRTILALHSIRGDASPGAMIAEFEGPNCFMTYKGERNPSFTTNCNVASCLLMLKDPSQYEAQIRKCIQFLCTNAFESGVHDKWNISEQYPVMLFSQTLVRFMRCLDDGSLDRDAFSSALLTEEIPIITLQILGKSLHTQRTDGSWDSKHEVTAYTVLALVALSSLPWTKHLRVSIDSAIDRGKQFLDQRRDFWMHGDHLWIEKVLYSSDILSMVYCLAASKATPSSCCWGPMVAALNEVPTQSLSKLSHFFTALPLFSGTPNELMQVAFVQSQFCLRKLGRLQLDIFPCREKSANTYLKYVPLTWTSCNNKASTILDPSILQEMIVLSVLVYQVDEFMESVVEQEFHNKLGLATAMLEQLFSTVQSTSKTEEKPFQNGPGPGPEVNGGCYSAHKEVRNTLGRFILYVLKHPKVVQSPQRLQERLARELRNFLFAHITQAKDNAQFGTQQEMLANNGQPKEFTSPSRTYYQWVRTTSADHTSCPFAFVFYCCLAVPPGADPFNGSRQAYIAEDMCRHLATMCRQYNDYGSILRDQDEGNLNSINFPEFHFVSPTSMSQKPMEKYEGRMKNDLFWLAEYERAGLETSLKALADAGVNSRVVEIVRLFVNVTDLYGEIYIRRDLTNRTR